jgi:hypothetical protein
MFKTCFRDRERHDLRVQHLDVDRLVLLQHPRRPLLHLHLLALPGAQRSHQAARPGKTQGKVEKLKKIYCICRSLFIVF